MPHTRLAHEPVRAWARHTATALAITAIVAAIVTAGVLAVLTLGTTAGIATTLSVAVFAVGTTTWYLDRQQ